MDWVVLANDPSTAYTGFRYVPPLLPFGTNDAEAIY